MDRQEMHRRVAAARVGRLATVRPDGRPHLAPCCFALDGDTAYWAVDAKPKSTTALVRLANLATTPAAALLVDHYDEEWAALWWVRVDGVGRVVDDDAEEARARSLLAAKYPQYTRHPPPGPVVALDLTGWRGWP